MGELEDWLNELLASPPVRMSQIDQVDNRPGVVAVWRADPRQCLYIGLAGWRKGEGLPGRLTLLHESDPGNSTLANHMQHDRELAEEAGYDFDIQQERQRFLAER